MRVVWVGFGLGWVAERNGADSGWFWIPFSDDERVWETDEWNWLSVRGKGWRVVLLYVAGLFIHDWTCLLRHVTPHHGSGWMIFPWVIMDNYFYYTYLPLLTYMGFWFYGNLPRQGLTSVVSVEE